MRSANLLSKAVSSSSSSEDSSQFSLELRDLVHPGLGQRKGSGEDSDHRVAKEVLLRMFVCVSRGGLKKRVGVRRSGLLD